MPTDTQAFWGGERRRNRPPTFQPAPSLARRTLLRLFAPARAQRLSSHRGHLSLTRSSSQASQCTLPRSSALGSLPLRHSPAKLRLALLCDSWQRMFLYVTYLADGVHAAKLVCWICGCDGGMQKRAGGAETGVTSDNRYYSEQAGGTAEQAGDENKRGASGRASTRRYERSSRRVVEVVPREVEAAGAATLSA